MNKLRQLGKKVMSAALMPLALAGAITFSPKQVNAEEVQKPTLELKLEQKSFGDETTGKITS